MIRAGQQVHFKPEFRVPADGDKVFTAGEDQTPELVPASSFIVVSQLTGWPWQLRQTVKLGTIAESGLEFGAAKETY